MTRTAWILVALATLACVVLVDYLNAERSASIVHESSHQLTAVTPVDTDTTTAIADVPALPQSETNLKEIQPRAVAAESIAKLAAAASGDDARTRADAIEALAGMPKAQAVTVLQRVLSDGIEDDRQLALNSLRTLALNQGDAEGEIRNILRLTIYDGDDAPVASSAQVLLDDIERDITSTH